MLTALGNRIIIKHDDVEKVSEGGIVFAQTEKFMREEKAATETGTIVDIGPSAWLDPALGGEPWCKVGDRVVYARYSGKFIKDPADGEEYVVINDDAIQALLGE